MREPRELAVVLLCVAVVAARPADKSARLDPATCRPASDTQKQWVPDDWQPFASFVRVCGIPAGKAPVLFVMSVWADNFEQTLPPYAPAVKLPKPLLLAADGHRIGELPQGFPRDPPRSLTLTFTKWSAGFPREIRLWLEDPAVSGNRWLPPLQWDEESGRFVKQAGVKEK